jgi:hypothetical protein
MINTESKQRQMFLEGLRSLPSEVALYWSTLCFYGYRQAAGRAALRTLLTHEEPEDNRTSPTVHHNGGPKKAGRPTSSSLTPNNEMRFQDVREALGKYSARVRGKGEHSLKVGTV